MNNWIKGMLEKDRKGEKKKSKKKEKKKGI